MAKRKKKEYRRHIRINGEVISSPRFPTAEAADDWYEKMRIKKGFKKFGLSAPVHKSEIPLFIDYCAEWLDEREREYPANTWKNDERRLRLHVLPVIGKMPINEISPAVLKKLLSGLTVEKTRPGGEKVKAKASKGTYNLIKALLSAIFESARTQDPPLIDFNPIRNLKEKKRGRKKGLQLPKIYLNDTEACEKFLSAADALSTHTKASKAIAGRAYVYGALALMSGGRKSELIALRWEYVDLINRTITFAWIYEQESKSLKQRTKKGEEESRTIPMPEKLFEILVDWKKRSPHSKPSDFVLTRPEGGHMSIATVRQMHNRILRRAELKVTPHGLRHTFGRLFIKKTGNLKALQEILGHSSAATTELYAKLDAGHLASFASDMDLGITAENTNNRRHYEANEIKQHDKSKKNQ